MAEQRGREMQSLQERVAYLEGRTEDLHVFRSEVSQRFDRMDAKFDRMDAKFDRLDEKVDRHFQVLVGLQVTSVLALFGAIIGLYFK